MKKSLIFLIASVLAGSMSFPQTAPAVMELRVLRDLDLKTTPLDVAPSLDGQWLYILTPGKILVYSLPEGKITDQISVGKEFDRIASLPRPNAVSISSTAKKSIQIILLEEIHKIDVSGSPFQGPQDAPVIVAVFTDYQWPYCAGIEPLLRQVLERNPKDVKLVMKHFPLPNHSYSRKAALAAVAAGKQGKFWEMHEKLYASQRELNDVKVEEIARGLGLNMEQFQNDVKGPEAASLVDKDLNDARLIRLNSTPSIYINGKLLTQRTFQGFQQAIDFELKKK